MLLHLLMTHTLPCLSMQAARSCPEYPVRNYTLELQNLSQGSRHFSLMAQVADGSNIATQATLQENSRYSFHVIVMNDVGRTSSREIQLSKYVFRIVLECSVVSE